MNNYLFLVVFVPGEAIEGYIHQLSTIKTLKKNKKQKNNYFDCKIQTSQEEAVRVVCYSPNKRITLQQAHASKSVKIVGTKTCTSATFDSSILTSTLLAKQLK